MAEEAARTLWKVKSSAMMPRQPEVPKRITLPGIAGLLYLCAGFLATFTASELPRGICDGQGSGSGDGIGP